MPENVGYPTTTNDEKIANLRYRRADSKSALSKYRLYQDAYTGHGGFSDGGYLKKGTMESLAYFNTRKKNPTYLNLFMPSVEKFHGWLTTGTEPVIKGSTLFEEFVKDINLVEHVRQLARIALVNGIGHSVLDAPSGGGDLYIVAHEPQNLFNWQDDQDAGGEATGFYEQAKIGIKTVEIDVSKAGEIESEQFFIWKPGLSESWKIIDDEPIPVNSIETKYDKAPVLTLSFVLGEVSINKISLFDSLARISKRLFNVMSEMEAFESRHILHALLTVPIPPGGSGGGTDPEDTPDSVETHWGAGTSGNNSPNSYEGISKANIFEYDPTDGGKPEMLKGDVSALTEWRATISDLIEWAAYVSGMRGPAAYLNPKSGEAYKQEFIDTRAILKTFAVQLEDYIRRLAAIWEMVTGNTAGNLTVEWPVGEPDNDILTLDQLDVLSMSRIMDVKIMRNQMLKEYARVLSRGDRELLSAMNDEIDELPEDEGLIPARPSFPLIDE